MKNKIIRQYYVLSCLFNACGIAVICAIYVSFLIKNGLSLFEVNIVNSTFALTLFIFEIPTGAFADIFGRKTSFVMSCILMSLGMLIYGASHTMFGFILAEVVSAIGLSLESGAFKAWLVDSLKHQGYDGDYTKIFARENLLCQISSGVSSIVGSYLILKNPSLPWYVAAVFMMMTSIFAMIVMEEEYFVKTSDLSWKKGFDRMRETAVSSIRYGMNDKAVRFILIVSFLQILAVQGLNMYWQPFFKERGIQDSQLGFLFAGILASMALGAFLISRVNTKGKEKALILKIQVGVGILIILTTLATKLPVIILFFMLHEVARGCWSPMLSSYLHERIPSNERATISSFCSIAPHIGAVFGLTLSGGVAQLFGIKVAWMVSGVAFVVGSLLVVRNGNSKH